MQRRFPLLLLVLIMVIGLFVVSGQSNRHEAWTQGYLTGLAAAGQDGVAIPYALAMQNQPAGPGIFSVIVGFGLLALLFMAVMRGMRYWMWQPAGGQNDEQSLPYRRHHRSWRGCWSGWQEAPAGQPDQPARQPMPVEPAETMQPTPTG